MPAGAAHPAERKPDGSDHRPPQRETLVLQGIRSARTLRTLSRAVASFGAFGRYDRVLLDLTHFRDGSPELAAALAADGRRSAASGRTLDFVPRSHLTAPPVVRDAPESRADRGRRPDVA